VVCTRDVLEADLVFFSCAGCVVLVFVCYGGNYCCVGLCLVWAVGVEVVLFLVFEEYVPVSVFVSGLVEFSLEVFWSDVACGSVFEGA